MSGFDDAKAGKDRPSDGDYIGFDRGLQALQAEKEAEFLEQVKRAYEKPPPPPDFGPPWIPGVSDDDMLVWFGAGATALIALALLTGFVDWGPPGTILGFYALFLAMCGAASRL